MKNWRSLAALFIAGLLFSKTARADPNISEPEFVWMLFVGISMPISLLLFLTSTIRYFVSKKKSILIYISGIIALIDLMYIVKNKGGTNLTTITIIVVTIILSIVLVRDLRKMRFELD